jgi:hypothetical protein
MHPEMKDRIAGLRAEAKHFRELAAMKRIEVRRAKANRAWVDALKAQSRVDEYVLSAQQRDSLCKELRSQFV